jgi:uncharacterized protein YegL
LLNFVIQVFSSFKISPNLARVALVRFSNQAQLDFNFDRFTSSQEMIDYVSLIDIGGGETNTTGAFYIVNSQVLPTRRASATPLVILITDGTPNIANSTLFTEVNDTKRTAKVFTVGITNKVSDIVFILNILREH